MKYVPLTRMCCHRKRFFGKSDFKGSLNKEIEFHIISRSLELSFFQAEQSHSMTFHFLLSFSFLLLLFSFLFLGFKILLYLKFRCSYQSYLDPLVCLYFLSFLFICVYCYCEVMIPVEYFTALIKITEKLLTVE